MNRIFTIISSMFFVFSVAEAQQNNISLNEFKAQNPDLDHFHSIDNHHYFVKDELISWTDAKNYGDQIGVSMYIINSSDEENEVYTNLPLSGNNGFGYLIGLFQDTNGTNYSEPDGGWKWVDGTSLTYSNWETNEPNNANNGEDYGQFDWQGGGSKWNDIASSPNVNKAIYEFVDYSADILLNGTVSAESNQIKNVADPINAQDVATKSYVDSNMYTQAQVDELINNLLDRIVEVENNSAILEDQDGNVFESVLIGNQVWASSDAKNSTYRDGTTIPQITDMNTWSQSTTGAWCYYENDNTKWKLYNWYAVAGIHDSDPNTPNKKFAPEGWRVATDSDWTVLENFLIDKGYNYDGSTSERKFAKAISANNTWVECGNCEDGAPGQDVTANNSTGFSAVPTGYIVTDFFQMGSQRAEWWTSTENESESSKALKRGINRNYKGFDITTPFKTIGKAVRIIKE